MRKSVVYSGLVTVGVIFGVVLTQVFMSDTGSDVENFKVEHDLGEPPKHSSVVKNLKVFLPKDKANVRSITGFNAPIVTNVSQNKTYPETIIVPTGAPIYDLAYVSYSTELAERFYWAAENIMDMPQDVGLLNYRIRTIGNTLSCTLGMLVKKDIGLNLPPRPYARHVSMGGG